jgi:hypothetical protein
MATQLEQNQEEEYNLTAGFVLLCLFLCLYLFVHCHGQLEAVNTSD